MKNNSPKEMDTKQNIRNAIKKASRQLLRCCIYSQDETEQVVEHLLADVIGIVFAARRKNGVTPKAEETVAEMIRLGVPKNIIRARYEYVEVSLQNAKYTFYRNGYYPDSIQIDWNGCLCIEKSTLSPIDLARTIIDLDTLLPFLGCKAEELIVKISGEKKAIQIQRATVKPQLEAVLPAMGIGCMFGIKDGVVQLQLSKSFSCFIDIPISELSAFLSDPERILSTLKPSQEGYVDDIPQYSPGHHFRFP